MDPNDIVSVVQDIQITRFCQRLSHFMDTVAGNALPDTSSSVSAAVIVIYDHGEHFCVHLLLNGISISLTSVSVLTLEQEVNMMILSKSHQFDPPTRLSCSIVWYGWVWTHDLVFSMYTTAKDDISRKDGH